MYQLLMPHEILRPHVECYWVLWAAGSQPITVQESIFVDGSADVIFNSGPAYQRQAIGRPDLDQSVTHSNLDALRKNPVMIAQHGSAHLVGIRFKPGGLSAFLRIPLHRLIDQVTDLNAIFGSKVRELESRFFDARANPDTTKTLLDEFLLDRFSLGSRGELAFKISEWITAANGRLKAQAISQEIGYSSRQLNRIFRQQLGFSPKFHLRIARFRSALHLILNNPQLHLLEIVAACGYYDQSHLTKEFQVFSGRTPKQYREQMLARLATAPPPNLVRFLQDS